MAAAAGTALLAVVHRYDGGCGASLQAVAAGAALVAARHSCGVPANMALVTTGHRYGQ